VSEITLERDEIVSASGRVFRRHNQEFLDNLPPDNVREMARRRLEEIQAIKAKYTIIRANFMAVMCCAALIKERIHTLVKMRRL
jgi:hypothetical protein